MSNQTKELLQICEQLPEAQRAQVTRYARSLLVAATSTTLTPLEALAALQASLGFSRESARAWIADAADERRAWGRNE